MSWSDRKDHSVDHRVIQFSDFLSNTSDCCYQQYIGAGLEDVARVSFPKKIKKERN